MLCSCIHLMLLLQSCMAWAPGKARPADVVTAAVNCHPRARCLRCYSDDDIDSLVLYGDFGVLLAYGSVQGIFDVLMKPLAAIQPQAIVPVLHAPSQSVAIASIWVGITLLLRGYRPSVTRSLPSRDTLVPLLAGWLGSTAVMLGGFVLLGLPLNGAAPSVRSLLV